MKIENEKVAVALEETNPDVVKIPIKKKIEINGQLIDELVLDFSNMTGEDILAIDAEMRLEGNPAGFTTVYSQDACLKLAARAVGTIPDDLKNLHGAEFFEMILQVRKFFIEW